MKRLTVTAITIVSLVFALAVTGCDNKPEEKASAPATTKTMKEQIPAAVEQVKEKAEHVVEEVKEKTEQVVEEAKKITAETVEKAKEAGAAVQETGTEMIEKANDKVHELTGGVNQEQAPTESTVQKEMEKKTLDLKKTLNNKLIEGC